MPEKLARKLSGTARAADIGSFFARKIVIMDKRFFMTIEKDLDEKCDIENLTIINESVLRLIQHFHRDRVYRANFKIFKAEVERLNKRQLLLMKKTVFLNNQAYIVLVHEAGKSNIVFQLWNMRIYTK